MLSSLARLESRWGDQLGSIQVLVEDVPDLEVQSPAAPSSLAPLGRTEEAAPGQPARIVVYRRAVEARAGGQRARETLVHEVVVERLAELLGLDPAAVDPDSED